MRTLLCSSTTKALHCLQCLQAHLLAFPLLQSHKGYYAEEGCANSAAFE